MKVHPSIPDLHIDLERLKRDILDLARIGRDDKDLGIYRMAFTEADLEGRQWLMDRMKAVGLATHMDGVANVFGRLEGKKGGSALLVGSHTDTVPRGGALDGALGVLAALECVRVIKNKGLVPECPISIVSFSDEEGRFGGMLGSQALVRDITLEDVFQKTDPDGVLLHEEMRARGLEPERILEVYHDSDPILAYLELHIEQGPVLEHLGKPVGIVDTITGLFKWTVRLIGKPNHAGTTPMGMRKDAFQGLAEFADEIPRVLDEDGTEKSRATIGRVQLYPGFPHTIPGEVEFSLVVRDADKGVLENLAQAFRKVLSAIARKRGLLFEYVPVSWIDPTHSDPELVELIRKKAESLGYAYEIMPSGAGHDAQFVSRIAPTAMIFVPSKDAVSHAPGEWTDWDDIEKGANLLLHATMELSGLDKGNPNGQPAAGKQKTATHDE